MQAGKLRTRIKVMRKSEGAQDSFGAPAISWTSLGVFSARVTALLGAEFHAVGQRFGEAQSKVEIRFQPSIEFRREDGIAFTISATEPTHNIVGVDDPDMRRRQLVIYTRELKS